jgi:hypothetical protein
MLLARFLSPLVFPRSENNIEKYPELAELIDVLDFRTRWQLFFRVFAAPARLFIAIFLLLFAGAGAESTAEEMKNCTKRSWI